MGEFGWAYVSGSQVPDGLEGSVQYKKGPQISGSNELFFDATTNTLVLSGTLNVSGAINANELNINVTNKSIVNISATGSTTFGDTTDDTHNFTGIVNLTAAADSALVYLSGSTFLTSSNSAHLGIINAADPNDISFVKATNPALVVSGAAVFNDPVSIQGGLFGASPIDIYAPLRYKAADDADDLLIQRGKFIGRVEISSSNAEHGLFMEGAARIKATTTQADDSDLKPELQFINDAVSQTTYPVIDLRKYNSVGFADHPQLGGATKIRKHDQYTLGDVQWATQLPILTGSDSSSLDQYQMTTFKASRITTTVDARRNAYQINFLTTHTNFDPEYELAFASGDASLTSISGALEHPFTASDFNTDPTKTVNSLIVGSFSAPGQGNIYGLKRGIMVGGNILPMGAALSSFGGGVDHPSHDGTIGHPVARWGDMYIHDDRYIRWGQTAGDNASDAYKRFTNSNPLTASARIDSGSVIFGYNSSSAFLEVSGATTYLNDNLNITGSGYINFGLTKGTSGYGFRDNSGTLEFKNSTGDWTEFGTGTGNSSIGAAEDGDYTDGLFTDFVTGTLVGVPIDRFNEVLKILAPSPAPALSRIDYTNTVGSNAKLTFDASNQITDYANSSTTAGFDAVVEDGLYESETSGSNERLGIYNGTQDIEGVLNFNVAASSNNGNVAYSADSFGNAEVGSLKLELNGVVVHTVDLSSFNSGNSYLNSTGSGFTSISAKTSTLDGNGANWGSIFNYRTAQYKIDTLDQRAGWNYARMIHTIGSTDYATNYVEWINDPDGSALALSVANPRIDEVALVGSKYVSGVQYSTDLTAKYKAEINNMYRNVYPDGNVVSFNVSNSDAISSQALEALGVGEDETKVTLITGSVNNNQNYLLNGSITVSLNATHPLKSNLSTAGSVTLTGMLIDNDTSGNNSNLTETFIDEDFRITSGAYDTQNSVTASSATWNSQNHMTSSGAAGHEDGMLFYNRRLYNPVDGDLPANGDFASLANVETGQPDYSSESGIRTYFRKIQNDSGGTIRDLKITSQKNGFKFSADTVGLDTNDSHFLIKIPGSTGWMNIRENFAYGSTTDGDGALIDGASDNSNVGDTGNQTNCITFGTQSVANNEYVLIKIETNGMQGYVSQLEFQLGASDVSAPTEAPVLDDIDLDDSAGETAKLSFGTSNAVAGYTNVAGGIGSMGAVNSNTVYTDNGDTNRGVFKTIEVMGGTLNEDISSNGDNYTANSFKNAYTGSLLLIVNDATASTLSLANLNTNNNLSSDTGFSVGTVGFSTTTDGIPDYTKTYRTGTYSIGTSQQRSGWNYARVIHRIGGTDTTTNYVQWVIDTSGAVDNTAVSTPVISNFNHPTPYYQSGIKYFASNPSASFAFTGSNFYNNAYQNGTAISFPTTTNCSVSNIRIIGSGITTFDSAVSSCDMPALNNSTDCELTSIEVTGTMLYNGSTPSISGGLGLFTDQDVAVTGRILHPLKSDRTTNSASKTSFMVYSGSIGSTTLANNEYFNTEDYRIVSGNYANQAAITGSSNTWNSQTVMNNGDAHDDGMVIVNGYALSPLKIGNLGDTRNVSDGGTLQAPTGNPNYSTLSNSTRTIYRYFRNNSGGSSITPTVTLYGDANLITKSGAFYTGTLGENKNITVELKASLDPNFTGDDDLSTAWADCIKPFSTGVQPTSDGVGIFNGGGSDLNQTVSTGGRAISLQLQQSQIRNNQYFVIKISAHKDWTGYLSRIQITY